MPRWYVQWLDLAVGEIRSYEPTVVADDARIQFQEMARKGHGRCAWIRLMCDARIVDEWRAALQEVA